MYIFPRLNIASIVAGLFRGYGLLVLLKWYRVIQKATLSLLCKRHTRVKLVSKVEQSTCITVIMPFYKSNYSTVLFSPIFKSWENSNSAVWSCVRSFFEYLRITKIIILPSLTVRETKKLLLSNTFDFCDFRRFQVSSESQLHRYFRKSKFSIVSFS